MHSRTQLTRLGTEWLCVEFHHHRLNTYSLNRRLRSVGQTNPNPRWSSLFYQSWPYIIGLYPAWIWIAIDDARLYFTRADCHQPDTRHRFIHHALIK